MKLEIAPRTVSEAERCARWRRENCPAAHLLFEEELRDAFDRIRPAALPGSAYQATSGRDHRRALMPEIRYHDYCGVTGPHRVRVDPRYRT